MRVSRVPKTNASTRACVGHAALQVLQQHPRVRRHRARDVADEHELARALARLAPAALDRLAAVAQRRAHRRAAGRRTPRRRGRPRPARLALGMCARAADDPRAPGARSASV
jgi:hypothetical protein